MKVLFENSTLPILADEACVKESDIEKCHQHFHGVNIKLTKCSGMTPARRMIEKAKSLNMKIMIGCMNESSIGSAAIAQLAPMIDYVDMDGPMLLSEDIAIANRFDFGKIIYNEFHGLGIESVSF